MDATIEMREHVRKIGWPQFPDEQVLFRIERVARRLRISARRARSYWYGEPATITADTWTRRGAWRARRWRKRPAMNSQNCKTGSRASKQPWLFKTRTSIALRLTRSASRLAVMIAPWIEGGER